MAYRITLKKLLNDRIEQYTAIVDQLSVGASKKEQLHVDFINFIKILEKLANRHLLQNDITNIAVIVLSAIVPIMININPEVVNNIIERKYLNLATILSVILAILNGLRQSYKFRERWQNYRQTTEQLLLEGQSYFALSGKYASFDDHDGAFKKFIESVNLLRTQQISNYISQLMSVNDNDVAKSVSEEVSARLTAINAAKSKASLEKLMNDELNAYVKNEPDATYFEADHSRKLITVFSGNEQFRAPEKFNFKNPRLTGQSYRVETAFAEPGIQGKLVVSSGVKNKDMPNRGFGAAGCILKRSDDLLVFLTCYHVVKHSNQDWDIFKPGLGHDNVIDTDGMLTGQIVDAEKSDELDTALIVIEKSVKYDDLLPGQVSLDTPVFIDESNLQDYQDVFIVSRTRNYRQIQGKLAEVNKHVTLNYGSKIQPDKKDLSGLMIVHYVSTEKFSLEGDSGSLVFTPDGTPIGIIVGGDLIRASFVIPFSTINDRYNFKFD